MILSLAGEIDYKMFNNLVKNFNDLEIDDSLHIYFTSPEGGYSDVAAAIINFINKNSSYIGMTFYGELFSAGMIIFLSVKCEKILLEDTRGMYHLSWQDMAINETGKPSSNYDIFCMKELKKSKIRTLESLKNTGMTEQEITKVKQGKDVYFSYERMLEINNNGRTENI